jgi:hypothetical protein
VIKGEERVLPAKVYCSRRNENIEKQVTIKHKGGETTCFARILPFEPTAGTECSINFELYVIDKFNIEEKLTIPRL